MHFMIAFCFYYL